MLLLVFLVTLGDHSGVPNVYLFTMLLAEGKGFLPELIFASAFLSIVVYENALYWLGRWMRSHHVRDFRVLRHVVRSTEAVTRLLSARTVLWLVFGRFIAFVGLYVPFAAGQMGRSYVAFAFWGTCGTLVQLLGLGIPVYLVGKPFESVVRQIPLGVVPVGILVVLAVGQLIVRYRRSRARRVPRLLQAVEERERRDGLVGETVDDEPEEHDADHGGKVEADSGG